MFSARGMESSALVANASGTPAAKTGTVTGTGVDMQGTDDLVTGIQDIGTVSGTNPTWDGKFQESDASASGYADITGATFTQVTASTSLQVITFQRTKRYVRYIGTIGGTSTPTFGLDALMIARRKRY